MANGANSTFAEPGLKKHPIDNAKVLQMTPKIEIDSKNKTFNVEINIPGFDDNEIDVDVHGGIITINAVSQKEVEIFDVYKVYKVNFNLPANIIIKDHEKVLENGELNLKGTLADQTSNKKGK